MEKEEVRVVNPVKVAGVTVIPVEMASLNYWRREGGISFFAVKRPVSVVVVTPLAKRAFRITGEEVHLDQLILEVPGMKEILDGI